MPFIKFICCFILVPLFIACQSDGPEYPVIHENDVSGMRDSLKSVLAFKTDASGIPFYTISAEEKLSDYSIAEVSIEDGEGGLISGYLLKPSKGFEPYPVMICLQGHAPGMYISIGEAKTKKDSSLIAGGRDLAIQSVKNGWAALVIEQDGFGERALEGVSCNDYSLRKLMGGSTMLGERVKDVSTAVNFIGTQPDLDDTKIGCMGNSSGGTTTYFAACMDERIDLAIVSCSFSTYASSWLKYPHCACGYVPGVLEIGDMPDLAALIVPRNLIIVAGVDDYLADIEGVREGFKTVLDTYNKHGATDRVRLIEGPGGHQFYPDLVWPEINKVKLKL